MSEPLSPMNAAHRKLLGEAAPVVPMPDEVRARALARFAAGVAALGTLEAVHKAAATWPAKTGMRLVALAFAVGAAVGVAGTIVLWRSPPAAVAPLAPSAAPTAPITPPLRHDVPIASLPSASLPAHAPSPPLEPASARPRDDDRFGEERRLLDEARRAFGAGDDTGSLAFLSRHRSSFPRGALAEERDALTVRALAHAGRMDEARGRADEFRKRYPTSLMRPVVEAAFNDEHAP